MILTDKGPVRMRFQISPASLHPARAALFSLLLCLAAAPAVVEAKPPLRDVAEIDDSLMAIAIADEIRKTCDDISARMIRALSTINGLKSRARELGYSDAEIENYVTSKSEKRRMRAKATAYLQAQGVADRSPESLCRFGAAQIKSGTEIGRLLR
jgi:hypothetical protein